MREIDDKQVKIKSVFQAEGRTSRRDLLQGGEQFQGAEEMSTFVLCRDSDSLGEVKLVAGTAVGNSEETRTD